MNDLVMGPFWVQLQQYALITIEAELCLIIGLLLSMRRTGSPWALRLKNWFRATARRQRRAVLLTGAIAILAHLAVLPVLRRPIPGIHDEFSYLLAAKTFASGRLTNPTHPLWIHFESFHIDQQPTYMSMYPPAQGMALAIGVILGDPAIGVWLTTALFCASLCWMLQSWVPPRWAFAGGLLAVMRIGMFSYWANTYWGGSVAAIGGCLIFGALGRIRRAPHTGSAVLLALGFIVVANSRPYEGFWMSLPVAAAILWWTIKRKQPIRSMLRHVVAPLALVVGIGGAAMAYYNWRVFGKPLTLPYVVNRETYSVAPSFPWQKKREMPHYNHLVMQKFYTEIEMAGFQRSPTVLNFLRLVRLKLFTVWVFFVGPALTLPLAAFLVGAFRKHLILRWPAAALVALSIGIAILPWPTNPHYYGPATACIYAVLIEGFRRMYVWRRKSVVPGKLLVFASVFTCLAVLGVRASGGPLRISQIDNITPVPWYSAEEFPLEHRARMIQALKNLGGKHVVVVRYAASHDPFQEYVYNDADIDGSDIVWAREITVPQIANLRLVNYFKDRTIWLFCPDESPKLYKIVGPR